MVIVLIETDVFFQLLLNFDEVKLNCSLNSGKVCVCVCGGGGGGGMDLQGRD